MSRSGGRALHARVCCASQRPVTPVTCSSVLSGCPAWIFRRRKYSRWSKTCWERANPRDVISSDDEWRKLMTNTTRVTQKPAFNWPPHCIAIFRALYLGDLAVSVPALRAIRAQFPEAEITLIGLPWAASFARRFSRYIDRFVEFPGYPGIHERPVDPARTHRFMEEQRAYGYDLVVQMQGNGQTSNRFALDLGSPVTVGYYPGVPSSGLTLGAIYPDRQPEIYRDLGLASLLGCDDLDPTLEFPLFEVERLEAARLLSQVHNKTRPLIGIHPGASRPSQRWPVDYFAR